MVSRRVTCVVCMNRSGSGVEARNLGQDRVSRDGYGCLPMFLCREYVTGLTTDFTEDHPRTRETRLGRCFVLEGMLCTAPFKTHED